MSSYARTTSGSMRVVRFVAWMAVLAGLFVAASTAFAQGGKVEKYTIVMKDYSYTPNKMTWHVGDTVQITLKNESTDKDHELLMGKDVNYSTDSFGKKYADGWKTPLFTDASQIQFLQGDGIAELRADGPETVALQPKGGHVTYTFTVPDKVGTWHFGCFEEDGSHFSDHNMEGTIEIVK
jgi:plastocyanin